MNAFGNPQQQQQQQQQAGSQPPGQNPGGGLFGTGTGTGTTGSVFGGGTGTSLFGAPSSTTTANPSTSAFGSTGGSGLFGGSTFGGTGGSGSSGTNPSPFTGMFGQRGATPTTTPATGTGTTGTGITTTGTTTTTPSSIFGGTSNSLFGATSTTPAPATTTTTAPATGGNLFGGGITSTNPTLGTTPGSLFGVKASTPTPQAGGSIFGNITNPAPSTTGGTASSIFGGGTTGTSSTLFSATRPTDAKPEAGGNGTANPTPAPAFGGLFGTTKPAENKDASKPATSGSLFSGPLNTNTTSGGFFSVPLKPPGDSSTNTATPTSSGLFGLPPKPADGAATSASTSTTTTGFGGSLFSTKKPETSTGPTTGGFSLGGTGGTGGGGLFGVTNKDATKPEEKKDAAPATTTNLFGLPKDSDKKDGTAAGTSMATNGSTSSGLFGKPADRKDTPADDKSKAVGTSSALTITAQPPSMLRGKTIEEIVNKWSSDLEAQVKEFSKFATEVAVWDRALIENGNSLAALMNEMLVAEREQTDIDQAFDHIEQQQKELMAALETYEKTAEESLNTQSGNIRALDTGPADSERDRNYMLATDLHTHLDDLSGSLTQMIDAVNALSVGPGSQQDGANNGTSGVPNGLSEDPMNQIAQILSSHLESLQWIDGSVRELESNVSEVEKRVREAGLSVNGGGSAGHARSTRSIGYGLR